MAKNTFTTFKDTDTQIRELLIEKFTYTEIKKQLSVSDRRISLVKKAMLSGNPIRTPRKSRTDASDVKGKDRNESVIVERSPEELENLRKQVEYKALAAMNEKLDTDEITVKDATAIISVVGEKPKQQGDTVVMLINSVGNMAVAARQLLINEAKAKQIPVASEPISITAENTDEHDDTMQHNISTDDMLPEKTDA